MWSIAPEDGRYLREALRYAATILKKAETPESKRAISKCHNALTRLNYASNPALMMAAAGVTRPKRK